MKIEWRTSIREDRDQGEGEGMGKRDSGECNWSNYIMCLYKYVTINFTIICNHKKDYVTVLCEQIFIPEGEKWQNA